MITSAEIAVIVETLRYDQQEGMDRLHALLRRLEEEEADFAEQGEEQERQASAA